MKLVIQRVKYAEVKVDGKSIGKIDKGFLVLLGVGHDDTQEIADKFVKKIINLRVFEDENGKMNKSIKDVNGNILIVSQFTLYADCSHGNRPSFINAGAPDKANELYEYFKEKCKEYDVPVESGIFGADMAVELLNDGPVTILLDDNNL
ncbi:MAG: D-tyrosyl-tRNA(Tyr) deacylase [Clostridia bacterium]|nr:D-tyrosyl-tRNA(Tyr) deacylase [Clostridia bacterium]